MKFHMQVLIALGLGLKRNWHIFAGLVLGVLVGIWLHKEPSPVIMTTLTFIGQVFIRLIQMVVIPLVISAIVIGITSIGDSKQLGKLGTKMIFYYTIITVAAVTIGAALALLLKPGLGAAHYINIDTAADIQAQVAATIEAQKGNLLNIFLGFIPKNPLASIASGDMVPIIVFAVMFSIALAKVGDINRPFVGFFESIFSSYNENYRLDYVLRCTRRIRTYSCCCFIFRHRYIYEYFKISWCSCSRFCNTVLYSISNLFKNIF